MLEQLYLITMLLNDYVEQNERISFARMLCDVNGHGSGTHSSFLCIYEKWTKSTQH